MNYNDFPILNSEDYELINKQYQNSPFERKDHIIKICEKLRLCRTICFEIEHQHNQKVKTSLQNTASIITKQIDNLTSSFNICTPHTNCILKTTIFSLLKTLNDTISLFSTWLKNEKKEYYITISFKSLQELVSCANEILLSLEESNVAMFKYM